MSYKRYHKYKDSDIKWLGKIPNHWSISKLKYLSDIGTGNKDTINKEEKGEYPFFVRSQTVERISTYTYDGEAVLTAGDGVGVGKVFHYINGKFDFHQRVYKISDFKRIKAKFFYYYIKEHFIKETEINNAKSTVDSIRLPMIQQFPVVIPSINEQDKIIKFLDEKTSKIDTVIEEKERLIELLKEKRESTITEMITRGLDKNVRMKKSSIEWIGEIPEHWEKVKLKFICNNITNKSSKFDNLKYLGLEHIEKGTGILIREYKSIETKCEGESLHYQSGDVLFGKLRPYLKKCIVGEEEGKCSSEFLVIRANDKIINTYLKYVLLSNGVIDLINSSTYGAKMPRASWEFVGDITIYIPGIKEQEELVKSINNIDLNIQKSIIELNLSIKNLKEYKKSLISEVVTGKIYVGSH